MNPFNKNTEQSPYQKYDHLNEVAKQFENKVPIRRGCPNGQCFCTGKCQEIIGWRDKTIEEKRGRLG